MEWGEPSVDLSHDGEIQGSPEGIPVVFKKSTTACDLTQVWRNLQINNWTPPPVSGVIRLAHTIYAYPWLLILPLLVVAWTLLIGHWQQHTEIAQVVADQQLQILGQQLEQAHTTLSLVDSCNVTRVRCAEEPPCPDCFPVTHQNLVYELDFQKFRDELRTTADTLRLEYALILYDPTQTVLDSNTIPKHHVVANLETREGQWELRVGASQQSYSGHICF